MRQKAREINWHPVRTQHQRVCLSLIIKLKCNKSAEKECNRSRFFATFSLTNMLCVIERPGKINRLHSSLHFIIKTIINQARHTMLITLMDNLTTCESLPIKKGFKCMPFKCMTLTDERHKIPTRTFYYYYFTFTYLF